MKAIYVGIILAILWPLSAHSDDATKSSADVQWPDCYCTDKTGKRIELGETIRMYVDGRSFTARCEMSLNNPMWRDTGDGCLSSDLGPLPLQTPDPRLDTGLVHAKI